MDTLSDLCSIHVPPKCCKNNYAQREKNINEERSQLRKISPLSFSVQSKLISMERDLISSHQKEKMFEESPAVTKFKSDSKFFFSSDMQRNLVCVLVKLVLFMIKR